LQSPYFTLNQYRRERFGGGVQRVTLEGGFTCPNRDGVRAIGGCTFCTDEGSSSLAQSATDTIRAQLLQGIADQSRRFGVTKFIAYFQSFSNTYAPVDELRRLYDQAINHPCVRVLAIGTRPDCLPDDVLKLIDTYAGRKRRFANLAEHLEVLRADLTTGDEAIVAALDSEADYEAEPLEIWLDIGVQTSHDITQERINRAHTYAEFVDAVQRVRALKNPHIRICTHVILGLPGETREMMLETATKLSELDIDDIKIHQLCIFKGTPLEIDYLNGDVTVFSEEEYIELLAEFLARLPQHWVVQRVMGEGPRGELIAPEWALTGRKQGFLKRLGEYFERGRSKSSCDYLSPSSAL